LSGSFQAPDVIEFKYRPDVDGLRAVAIALVLLYHGGLGFSGGYIGVDVFFVISGFLITGLILKDQQMGSFRLSDFWARRIRRILPASTVMVVSTFVVGAFLLLPADYLSLGKSTIAQQLMLANVYFRRNTGYFDGAAEVMPLLHTWSLAVEEQFYLVYPFFLALLGRAPKNVRVGVLMCLLGLSLLVSEWYVRQAPSVAFFYLQSRAWELLLGGLIWSLPAPTFFRPWQASALSWISLGTIGAVGWLYDSATRFPGLLAVPPCAASAVLIYTNSGRLTGVGRLLAAGPAVFLGLISYSLYLWHWPILAFTHYLSERDPTLVVRIVALMASLGVAYLSWRFVETPFRQMRSGRCRVAYLAAGASAFAVLMVGTLILRTDGAPARFSAETLRIAETGQMSSSLLVEPLSFAENGELPTIGSVAEAGPPRILFWGDSHLSAISTLCDELARDHGVTAALAIYPGVPPLVATWRRNEKDSILRWSTAIETYVRRSKITDVVLVARWSFYVDPTSTRPHYVIIDAQSEASIDESPSEIFRRSLRRTVDSFHEMGTRLWIMKEVPSQPFHTMRRLQLHEALGLAAPMGATRSWHLQQTRDCDRAIDDLAPLGVNVLDPLPYCFDENGHSMIFDGTLSLYLDDNHLSVLGADQLLRPVLNPLFAAVQRQGHDRGEIVQNQKAR
jgi:peptidoglycan/LPS O-acetylase OafA/YrhL